MITNSSDKHCEKGARAPSPFKWSWLPLWTKIHAAYDLRYVYSCILLSKKKKITKKDFRLENTHHNFFLL